MFPNLRLMFVTTFAAILFVPSGFALIVAFLLAREPLARMPAAGTTFGLPGGLAPAIERAPIVAADETGAREPVISREFATLPPVEAAPSTDIAGAASGPATAQNNVVVVLREPAAGAGTAEPTAGKAPAITAARDVKPESPHGIAGAGGVAVKHPSAAVIAALPRIVGRVPRPRPGRAPRAFPVTASVNASVAAPADAIEGVEADSVAAVPIPRPKYRPRAAARKGAAQTQSRPFDFFFDQKR